jgi:NADH:ubiquinone oxidoreductase subunit B-like Fe-S oxidoreductase
MAEVKFGEIKTQFKKQLANSQVMLDFTVEGKDGKRIKKVLSLITDPKITSVDALNGEAVVGGRVNYKVLYLNEDDEIVPLDYFADYTDRMASAEILPSSTLKVKTSIADVSVKENENISVSIVLENTLYAIVGESLPVVRELPENYFGDRAKVTVQAYGDELKSAFEVAEESAAGGSVDRILSFETAVAVNGITIESGVATVKGYMYATVFYVLSGGAFQNKYFEIPFSHEQAVPQGIDLRADYSAHVKSAKTVLTGTEDSNIIRVEGIIEIELSVVYSAEEEVVTDVFSLNHELAVTTAKTVKPILAANVYFGESVTGSIELDAGIPLVNDILGYTGARNTIAALRSERDRATVEGVASVAVLYRDPEDVIQSVNVEIPYSVNVRDTAFSEGDTLDGSAIAVAASARRKKDREIEVSVELFFGIEVYKAETVETVSEITEGDEKSVATAAVSLYNVGENESLWEIAKALSCTPSEILTQNPELVLPAKTPVRVALFRVAE